MSVIASCGHELKDDEEVVGVRNGHETCDAIDGFRPCVEYLSYCPSCAERAKSWDTYLADEVSDDWWFSTGYREWRARFLKEQEAETS